MNNGILSPIRLSVALRADPADLTNGQLAAWLLVSDETISNVRNGGWDARFEKLNNGFRHMPDSTANAFFAPLFVGTRWHVQRCDDVSGDVNGDGRVTPDDMLVAVARAAQEVANLTRAMADRSRCGVLGVDESAQFQAGESRIVALLTQFRKARETLTVRGPRAAG
jgi:hypothetical protein